MSSYSSTPQESVSSENMSYLLMPLLRTALMPARLSTKQAVWKLAEFSVNCWLAAAANTLSSVYVSLAADASVLFTKGEPCWLSMFEALLAVSLLSMSASEMVPIGGVCSVL